MDSVKSRRRQYAESTRRALLDTGLRLFADRGYAEVSAEELVRAAGLTRGALYHHFDGKQGLFQAVFEELEDGAAHRIAEAMSAGTNPWDQARAGVEAFLDVCADRDYREIVLLQGPIALGWHRWRELDQRYLGGLILDGVRALRDAGLIQPHPAELTAAAFYGALTEISLTVAQAGDPRAARGHASALARSMLDGLRPGTA